MRDCDRLIFIGYRNARVLASEPEEKREKKGIETPRRVDDSRIE